MSVPRKCFRQRVKSVSTRPRRRGEEKVTGWQQFGAEGAVKHTRKLLVLDTAFTFEAIVERELGHSVKCRDLGGFFSHVWSVHPFATLSTTSRWGPEAGGARTFELAPRHTVIEGSVGRFRWLQWAFAVNFVIAQIDLWFCLWRLIRREGVSVIRVGSPLYVGLFGLALARACRVPFVIRIGANNDRYFETTGLPVEPRLTRSRNIEKIIERFVLPRADLVAAANEDNLQFALANGASRAKSTLFRYGNLVDPRHFVSPQDRQSNGILSRLCVQPGAFILYVGRLEPIKQPDHVVAVLAEMIRRGFPVKAVLAGDGTMRTALVKQAERLGVRAELIFAGNVGQPGLAELFPAAAAVVSPHTGRALSEAALGGAPIAAYDVDWQGELIESGVTGVLVPPGDSDALSEGVAFLLGNPKQATALGTAVRERALKMLDPEVLNEHERAEYRKVLGEAGSQKT